MARSTRYVVIAVLLAAASTASYVVGVRVGRAQSKVGFASVLASVQVDLGLNHLRRLRELEGDLAHGCSNEALAKVRFDTDTQMYVLSSLYNEHKDTWVVASIAKEDPSMPAQLERFRKQYDIWTEPKCAK